MEAEENGQGEAIARNLFEMSNLQVPILSVVIGEGGSGGALAMATSDEVWLLENSIYSILSPEGFASILWKDGKRAPEAAALMKVTAKDLLEMGIVDDVIEEPMPASEANLVELSNDMKNRIRGFLAENLEKEPEVLAEERYARFRQF